MTTDTACADDPTMTSQSDHDATRYRIIEAGYDCGPVTSWIEVLDAIDEADLGDGAPTVLDTVDDRWLRRDEVAAHAARET